MSGDRTAPVVTALIGLPRSRAVALACDAAAPASEFTVKVGTVFEDSEVKLHLDFRPLTHGL